MVIANGRNKKCGGVPSRIGEKFHLEVEKIKDARLRNGKSKDRVSTEKLTNLVTRHNLWPEILTSLIDASEEEVNEFGI